MRVKSDNIRAVAAAPEGGMESMAGPEKWNRVPATFISFYLNSQIFIYILSCIPYIIDKVTLKQKCL